MLSNQSISALLPLLLMACSGKADTSDGVETSDPDVYADADADGDADTDTDVDTDTDADSEEDEALMTLRVDDGAGNVLVNMELEVGIVGGEMQGAMAYTSENVLAPASCDITTSFTGSPYIGDCEDCEMTFQLDEAVSRINHTDGICIPHGPSSLVAGDIWDNFKIGFGKNEESFMWVGYDVTSYQYSEEAEDYYPVTAEGGQTFSESSSVSVDIAEDSASLSAYFVLSDMGFEAYINNLGYCQGSSFNNVDVPQGGVVLGSSGLECPENKEEELRTDVDIWEMPAAAGDVLSITIDTVAADSAFTPYAYVFSPQGCLLSGMMQNVACSFTDSELSSSRAATRFEAPVDGDYHLIIGAAKCVGDEAISPNPAAPA